MARGFSAGERTRLTQSPSLRLKEVAASLSKASDRKASKHAKTLLEKGDIIERAVKDPAYAATLYSPSPSDAKDISKSIIQREVYEAYKAAGRLSELPKARDIQELWERYGKDAKRETYVETDENGTVVVMVSGKHLGVSDGSSINRYRPGYMNRDGVAWHNHPDTGPDGRVWGFPPSPHDVSEMLIKGHRTWHIGTLEGSYEMTIKDSSPFRSLEGADLLSAVKQFNKVVHAVWVGSIKEGKAGCMRDKERGTTFTNNLNRSLKDALGKFGIEYGFKPKQPGFKRV